MTEHWLVGNQAAVAAERILDAAGICFARQGVARTSIGDIATAAGCSRPTVYRYFADRDALRQAFMHREARRLSQSVAMGFREIDDPGRRVVEAVLISLQGVRANPVLAAWFTSEDGGATTELAGASPIIASLTESLLPAGDPDGSARAQWMLRIILSLLLLPGGDEREERQLLERFVVPVVAPIAASSASA